MLDQQFIPFVLEKQKVRPSRFDSMCFLSETSLMAYKVDLKEKYHLGCFMFSTD